MSGNLSDLDRNTVETLTTLSIYCELLVAQNDTEVATKAYNLIWAQRSDFIGLLNRSWRRCPDTKEQIAIKSFLDELRVATSAPIFPASVVNETLVQGLKAMVQAISNPTPQS